MTEIRVAVAGVGNCASSLVQGVSYYSTEAVVPGLLRPQITKYKVNDIKFVCGFDIDERKVNKDLSEAIFAKPNNTKKFSQVKFLSAPVYRGPTLDGFPPHFNDYPEDIRFIESTIESVDVVKTLKKHAVDVLVNYMPVGSEKAAKFYADCCLQANVCFINAMPVFICSDESWVKKFKSAKLVCAGDDVKSQVGATITHRTLVNLFERRGIKLDRTYQLNVGGNTDFLNMLSQERLKLKRISKTNSIQTLMATPLVASNIRVGPSDFVQWMHDQKTAFVRLEGTGFGGLPITIDLKIDCEDSPNSAGVVIDVIRFVKAAHDRKLWGALREVSAFAFKSPLEPMTDDEAFKRLEEWQKSLT